MLGQPPIQFEYALVAGFAAFAVGYLIAFWRGARRLSRGRREHQAELEQTKSQLRRDHSLSRLHLARGSMYRAAAELTAKNYGTARDYVRQALDDISHVEPGSMGAPEDPIAMTYEKLGLMGLTEASAEADRLLLMQLGEQIRPAVE